MAHPRDEDSRDSRVHRGVRGSACSGRSQERTDEDSCGNRYVSLNLGSHTELNIPHGRNHTNVSSFTGKLINLRELNVNYNKLKSIPAELGECENLERLEMTGNRSLSELPFEVQSCSSVIHIDSFFYSYLCLSQLTLLLKWWYNALFTRCKTSL